MRRQGYIQGFTIIELVMVILLVAILAAVAVPNFIDFRTDANNAAVQGALGGLRSAIAISRAAIALREDPSAAPYPQALEMQANSFNASHPVLNGKKILDSSGGSIPPNPWSLITIPKNQQNTIFDCSGMTKGFILSTVGLQEFGWCYDQTAGVIWPNSTRNGGGPGLTENNY